MELKNYELIITEKPKVSLKIAQSLAEGKFSTKKHENVSYYVLKRSGKTIVIAPAVGHVFTLKHRVGKRGYPIFAVSWLPVYKANRFSAFTKPYVETLEFLAKNATSYVSACDYDLEGELIGYNVLKFICGENSVEKARRMKFSALTKESLVNSYENALPNLDFNLADSGMARHILDWYWGMNTSRALSHAYKAATQSYMTLSAGRVQTPTLKILDDREKEIRAFKPEPFWIIGAIIKHNKTEVLAEHKTERFFDKKEAEKAYKNCKGKDAIVSEITKRQTEQKPPFPFNLGDLQQEAYSLFKYVPKRTQAIAQSLYEKGLISYPRTGSQKLTGIDFKSILQKLSETAKYRKSASTLLSQPFLTPNEGNKTDPAHPCIYPTGEPDELESFESKLYDLIVKRFLSCFGKPAVRETQTVNFKIGPEDFFAKGSRTLEKNWHEFYEPYVKLKDEELPPFEEGKFYKVKELLKEERETQPPSRYNAASIVRKMEDLGIGTKSTRANIVQTLYDRGYIIGINNIHVTEFGATIVETLEDYVPELTSEDLTKKFEDEIEKIQSGELKKDNVVKEAEETLTKIMSGFKEKEMKIGRRLKKSYYKARQEQAIIGTCPNCGSNLIIRVSRASRKQFIGCAGYPKCTTGFPLPQGAIIVKTGKLCQHDNLPIIQVVRKGKRKFEMCISPTCKSKEEWNKKNEEKKKKAEEKLDKKFKETFKENLTSKPPLLPKRVKPKPPKP